jgi:uncharacterized protein
MKKTVIIGATTNPARYAFLAADMLIEYGHEIIPVGIREGRLHGKEILLLQNRPKLDAVDTVTLYISPPHQIEWYDCLLGLKPKRIIFNPGTENPDLEMLATKSGIETVEGCTLVMF